VRTGTATRLPKRCVRGRLPDREKPTTLPTSGANGAAGVGEPAGRDNLSANTVRVADSGLRTATLHRASEGTDPTVSAGAVVGLIFAIFFAIGVAFLCVVLLRLAQVLKETKNLVAGISEKTTPLLGEITTTVTTANEQLGKVDVITDNVSNISTNASALASTFSATVGGPMIKAAAFSYGVRSALTNRRHAEVEKRVKSEMKAARKAKKGE
jgi:uncharacterized protein YoxC